VELVSQRVFGMDVKLPALEERTGSRSDMLKELKDKLGQRIEHPFDGCGVVMRTTKLYHIGLYCDMDDGAHLLHTMRGQLSSRPPLYRLPAGHVLEGFYQWRV